MKKNCFLDIKKFVCLFAQENKKTEEKNVRARLERQFFNFMAKILWQNFP